MILLYYLLLSLTEKGLSSKSHDRLQFSMPTLEDKAEAEAQGPFEQRRWCISTGQSYLRVYAHIVQGMYSYLYTIGDHNT